jgi:hypothetical protein
MNEWYSASHSDAVHEVHHVRLYEATAIANELSSLGFQVETTRSYGQYVLLKGHVVFIARKPGL